MSCTVASSDCDLIGWFQVIVTVPLAVLKSNMVTFNPPLDERKRQAIDKLGAGLVEKVSTLHTYSPLFVTRK